MLLIIAACLRFVKLLNIMSLSLPPQTSSPFQAFAAVLTPALVFLLSHCSAPPKAEVVVSVKDQKMGLYSEGKLRKQYPISTSKFGLGDELNSYRTPLGKHEVIAKIGHGLPTGAVLKSRHWNGEVLKPNAPGRDPIVSRILWLRGLERENSNAMRRYIYIHGTTEENRLGTPASYGCIRMGMRDVVDAFNEVGIGAKVVITKGPLPNARSVVAAAAPEAKAADKKTETESQPEVSPKTEEPPPLTLEPAPVLAVSPDQGKPPMIAEPVELKRSFFGGLFGGRKNIVVSEAANEEKDTEQKTPPIAEPKRIPEIAEASEPKPSFMKRLFFGKPEPKADTETNESQKAIVSASPKDERVQEAISESPAKPSFIKRLFFGPSATAEAVSVASESKEPASKASKAKPTPEDTVGPTAEPEQVARGKTKKDQAVRTSKSHPEVA